MTQLTIEIEGNKALKLIKDLEALKLIRVLKGKIKYDTSLKGTPVRAKRKLSRSFDQTKQGECIAGAMYINDFVSLCHR